ncbi:MAG: hypothetical protein BRC27_02515 [Nanohaloarchaea archaeon SW_10_44_10]|nr:MAG: hypothetical protein BRC27_02515 [Nanohaloarchaea archaeon SW_10_44_10]
MHLTNNQTGIQQVVEQLFVAPIEQPEILPTVLPLIIGAIAIELYFGKHPEEKLGWNSSVGNAIIWTATGFSLLITSTLTGQERQAVYGLILMGGIVGYMNFYHRWPPSVAYLISSSGIVYSLAYSLVVVIKTDLIIDQTVLEAVLVFVVAINMLFKLMKGFETPSKESQVFTELK